MAGIQAFDFDPARLEGAFSDLQPVSDSVQRAESATPGCCGRTHVTIACRAIERGYSLQLPLKGKLANETPGDPPSNHFKHVMTAQVKPPLLQVLSGHEGNSVAEITTTAEGPQHCPPGVLSKLRVEGLGGGTREVPQTSWTWPAPAILNASLLEELDDELISLLNPFKMPDLPAQTWSVDLPRCPMSRISARVAAFPDVRWTGRLVVTTRARPEAVAGYELEMGGDLACQYDGRRWTVADVAQAKALCRWIEGLEVLARSVVALMSLQPGPRHSGLDNPRLSRLGGFRFEPWPQMTIQLDASLFEQEGNGLLGHSLKMRLLADPLLGAAGEMSLLGPWLEQADKKPLIAPLLGGLDVQRAEEIAQELGVWLVADGQISLRAGVEARRPLAHTAAAARSSGAVALGIEARSIRDYDSFVIHQGGGADSSQPSAFRAVCKPPDESPLDDPKEHKPKAALEFSGLMVSGVMKSRPGCCFRHHARPPASDDAGENKAAGCLLAPSRAWPGDASIKAPAEVPWCS
jgi:hypothetical protein